MIIQECSPGSEAPAGTRYGLRSGETVQLKVLRAVEGGWEVSVRGKILRVGADTPLSAGMELSARVFFRGRTIVFKTQPPDANITEFLKTSGLPDDAISRLLLRAFRLSGLPLKPGSIMKYRALLKDADRVNGFAARLLAIMHDKGIQASPEMLQYICDLGKEGSPGRKDGGGKEKEEEREGEEEDVHEIARQGEAGNPLQLFNHLAGEEDHWVILPLRADAGNGPVEGSLRLRYEKKNRTLLEAHLFCETGKRSWWFGLPVTLSEGAGVTPHTNILPEGPSVREELGTLRQKLHNLGVKVDDIIKVDTCYEGLTAGEVVQTRGVDTYV